MNHKLNTSLLTKKLHEDISTSPAFARLHLDPEIIEVNPIHTDMPTPPGDFKFTLNKSGAKLDRGRIDRALTNAIKKGLAF